MFLSARKQHFWETQTLNFVNFYDFSLSLLSFSLLSVQERGNVVSLLTRAKTDCPLFFVFSSQKQPIRDTLGDMWSPETLGYNQTQEPQRPDSATTTTGSCSDSALSKKH